MNLDASQLAEVNSYDRLEGGKKYIFLSRGGKGASFYSIAHIGRVSPLGTSDWNFKGETYVYNTEGQHKILGLNHDYIGSADFRETGRGFKEMQVFEIIEF